MKKGEIHRIYFMLGPNIEEKSNTADGKAFGNMKITKFLGAGMKVCSQRSETTFFPLLREKRIVVSRRSGKDEPAGLPTPGEDEVPLTNRAENDNEHTRILNQHFWGCNQEEF